MSHRILFFSSSKFAIPLLDSFLKNERVDELFLVSAQSADFMKTWAEANGVRFAASQSLAHEPDLMAELKAFEADFLITFSFGQILKRAALDLAGTPALNIHPSLLPQYRGPAPMVTALLNGDTESGITLIQMVEKMDAGPILAQQKFLIPLGIRLPELEDLVGDLAAQWVPDWVLSTPWPEFHEQVGDVSFTRKVEREDGFISFQDSAEILERKSHAYHPWPGLYLFYGEKRLKLLRIAVSGVKVEAGFLAAVYGHLFLGTSKGSLQILELQLEGKRAMSGEDFLRGLVNFQQARLRGRDE